MLYDLSRRLVAETLGTALLVATVVGSGIMAESLTRGTALALLGNTIPTGSAVRALHWCSHLTDLVMETNVRSAPQAAVPARPAFDRAAEFDVSSPT